MRNASHTYQVSLSEHESETLAWLASRYESADLLWLHTEHPEDASPGDETYPSTIVLPEHVAWEYLDLLADENGNPNQMIPACVGGELADKLLTLYVEIV